MQKPKSEGVEPVIVVPLKAESLLLSECGMSMRAIGELGPDPGPA